MNNKYQKIPEPGTMCECLSGYPEHWNVVSIVAHDYVDGKVYVVTRLDKDKSYEIFIDPNPKHFRGLTDPMTPKMLKAQRIYDISGIRGLFDIGMIEDDNHE